MNAIEQALRGVLLAGLAALLFAALPQTAEAHCDTLNGPVVGAARTALGTGSLLPVLQWVRKEDEDEIEQAFRLARKAREGGPEAKELAERWFFETVVRVHRAGEGVGFTGLKPAAPPEPGVAEADAALERGEIGPLTEALAEAVAHAVRERYEHAKALEPQRNASVEAGRAYVAAYVGYVHFVEALHGFASGHGHAHGEPAAHGEVAQAAPAATLHAHAH